MFDTVNYFQTFACQPLIGPVNMRLFIRQVPAELNHVLEEIPARSHNNLISLESFLSDKQATLPV